MPEYIKYELKNVKRRDYKTGYFVLEDNTIWAPVRTETGVYYARLPKNFRLWSA